MGQDRRIRQANADIAIEFVCPKCKAVVGEQCWMVPPGNRVYQLKVPHMERCRFAMDRMGKIQAGTAANSWMGQRSISPIKLPLPPLRTTRNGYTLSLLPVTSIGRREGSRCGKRAGASTSRVPQLTP